MKGIDEYTTEELVSLYKRLNVYATTWWFKYCRMYKMDVEDKEKPMIQVLSEPTDIYSQKKHVFLFSPLHLSSIGQYIARIPFFEKKDRNQELAYYTHVYMMNKEKIDILSQDAQKNHNAIMKLVYENSAIDTMSRAIWWCDSGCDKFYDTYLEGWHLDDSDKWVSKEELEVELYMNDDRNIQNGIATDYCVYQFVWQTLQYLNIEQLDRMLNFADRGIETKWENMTLGAGRKSRNCELHQIDIDSGETVRVFNKRNDAISELGIKKSHLCQCIKTSANNPSDMSDWKKWIGSDGKRYGFTESLKP